MSSKVPSDFDQWKELNAELENRFALMERIMNLARKEGAQMLTHEEQQLKDDTPDIEKRLILEIPALQEEIDNVENKIKGKGTKIEKNKLNEAKNKNHPVEKEKLGDKNTHNMLDLSKDDEKKQPLGLLPPHVGLALKGADAVKNYFAKILKVREETKNKQILEESSPYRGQENLREYGSPPLPSDTRHQPSMEEYKYSPGVDQTSGDFGDNMKPTLGGKRRKKKSRRRRTKKKKRRRKKKTRKKRKKRKRRRRTKKN